MKISRIVTAAFLIFALTALLSIDGQAQNFSDWTPEEEKNIEQDLMGDVPSATFDQRDIEKASAEDIMKMVEPPVGVEMLESTGGKYTLGSTDVIEITVMRHPEVTGEYPINMEGKIQYEFVGDLSISGMTKEQATDVIREALSEYIVSPEVSVKIIGYNSKIVYVVGEVFRPGKIFMRGDTITVREALMQAGLPRLSGVTKKSRLIKQDEGGRPKKKYLNVYALIYEGDLRFNETMEPGDVLYIPPTFLTKVMRAISPVAAPIGQAAGASMGVNTIGAAGQPTNY